MKQYKAWLLDSGTARELDDLAGAILLLDREHGAPGEADVLIGLYVKASLEKRMPRPIGWN